MRASISCFNGRLTDVGSSCLHRTETAEAIKSAIIDKTKKLVHLWCLLKFDVDVHLVSSYPSKNINVSLTKRQRRLVLVLNNRQIVILYKLYPVHQ